MENQPGMTKRPSREVVDAVLAALGHAGAAWTLGDFPTSYSNFTHWVEFKGADGEGKIVLRRYSPAHDEPGAVKATREFKALELLHRHGARVPKPLLLDATGDLLGLPGIVTEFVDGKQIEPPTQAALWGKLATANALNLARIHRTPFRQSDKRWLMNDNVEVAWFIKDGEIPDYMRRDPDGERVWHLVNEHWHSRQPTPDRFQHTDYWSGNILWQDAEIAAVVDWEEAGYGDAEADVAYARMEYFLEGLPDAAETFRRVYQAETGCDLPNLPLMELAASARVMTDPDGWFTRPYMEERYRRFIEAAISRFAQRT